MALSDNVVQQVQPVAIMGSIAMDGGITSQGSLATTQKQYTTATASIVTSDGLAGAIATGGKMTLQNCGTAAVYVKRGTGASSSSFNWILSACVAQDDGVGGSCVIDDFVGQVTIDGVATPRVAVTIFS